jgi:ABC-type sulfate transport system substrate-binding protein
MTTARPTLIGSALAALALSVLSLAATFEVEELLGPWGEVQKKHFADGGIFDRIMANR